MSIKYCYEGDAQYKRWQHVGWGEWLAWTWDPAQQPKQVWIMATWTGKLFKSRLLQTLKNASGNASLWKIVVIIKGQTTPKKIPKDSSIYCWLVKPNMIYSAQTAMFTPQCGCQRHHIHLFNSDTLSADRDRTLCQKTRTRRKTV